MYIYSLGHVSLAGVEQQAGDQLFIFFGSIFIAYTT